MLFEQDQKSRQRIETLFADLDRLAAETYFSDNSILQRELESLRMRLADLELEVRKHTSQAQTAREARPNEKRDPAILFEKDQASYVYFDENRGLDAEDSTLLNTDGALNLPLLAGGKMVGQIKVGTSLQNEWNQDDVSLANSIAQQVSFQIHNLRLLAATEQARAEAASATRQFIHDGWDSYLDAIQRSERIGYSYDQSEVKEFVEAPGAGGIRDTISVMDEKVGVLYVEQDPARPLSEADEELVSGVARHVAQQVENIRLLADASRARAEAENAIRGLTRENWQAFTQDKEPASLGFMYDSLQVLPLDTSVFREETLLSQPLTIRGETVGQLAVAGAEKVQGEAGSLIAAIAAQASLHLETLRLTEELQKRARALQELDRLKSAFLANMSHELRTPLNSILGFSDVILEGLDGDVTDLMENDLKLIQKNGRHLLHLINDVLDMAKIESGRMNLHPEKFALRELLEEVRDITSPMAGARSLLIHISGDPVDQALELFADRTRIQQVMINLVNNAIKFTDNGEVEIHVEQADERALIRVRDTGIGIPVDQLESIFKEFAQVDTSTTRKSGGTGLGLPISRRLVELHGGLLWAESAGKPGEGSTFHVELPLQARILEPVERQVK